MRERLLVVDDDPGLLLAVSDTLREAGFEVSTARRGAEALTRIAESDNAKLVLLPADLQSTLRGLFQRLPGSGQ